MSLSGTFLVASVPPSRDRCSSSRKTFSETTPHPASPGCAGCFFIVCLFVQMGIRNEHCGPGAEITPHSKTLPSSPNCLLNHITCWLPTHLPKLPSAQHGSERPLVAASEPACKLPVLECSRTPSGTTLKKKKKATLCRPHPSACPVAPLAPRGSDQSSGACCRAQAGSPRTVAHMW